MSEKMSPSLQPEGESLRKAMRWLSSARVSRPQESRLKLIDEAALQFDLTPHEVQFLEQNWGAEERPAQH